MSYDLCRGKGLVRVPCPDKRAGCCVAHYGRCPNGCEVPAPRGDFMTYRIEDKLAPVAGLPKEKP